MGKEVSLKKEAPNSVTLLQAVIFLQFSTSFFIVVLTTVGISFDYPVASFYLMALLQVVVAIPGVVHIALQGNVWVAIYISFQLVTASCELYWLIYMIFDNARAGKWIGLAALLAINISAVVVAIWFRQKMLAMPWKKDKKTDEKKSEKKEQKKPEMKLPSTSMMSESEVPKRSSKESSSRSNTSASKKSSSTSTKSTKSTKSAMSSKSSSSLKSISTPSKKSPRMPLDSRETTSPPVKSPTS